MEAILGHVNWGVIHQMAKLYPKLKHESANPTWKADYCQFISLWKLCDETEIYKINMESLIRILYKVENNFYNNLTRTKHYEGCSIFLYCSYSLTCPGLEHIWCSYVSHIEWHRFIFYNTARSCDNFKRWPKQVKFVNKYANFKVWNMSHYSLPIIAE